MGFLDNTTLGFGNVTVVGSSNGGSSGGGSSQNPDVIFKETSSTLLSSERSVASREATSNITYTLPDKNDITGNAMFEIINMNNTFNISVVDAQDGNIDGSNPFVVGPNSSISLILDKENLTWKSVNGI